MALENAIMSAYYSPASAPRNHSRRSSTRRSFATIPSIAGVESPRTLCPRDGDAFSYSPSHLKTWFISEGLWDNLPATVQYTLATLQHSGAAVLTGFDRLEKHSETAAAFTAHAKTVPDVAVDDSIEGLDSPKLSMTRTLSDASSRHDSACSSRSCSPPPSLSSSEMSPPISPMALTPATPLEDVDPFFTQSPTGSASRFPHKTHDPETDPFYHKRHHVRRVTFPLEPHKAYYMTELTQLRTESLPRLRHAARKVETEWYECKRLGAVTAEQIVEFEKWYIDKKATIRKLDDKCKELCAGLDVPTTGMGWTAP